MRSRWRCWSRRSSTRKRQPTVPAAASTALPGARVQLVVISPSKKTLLARLSMDLVNHLMRVEAVDISNPPAVYDGRKNVFAPRELRLGPNGSQEVSRLFLSDDMNRGSPGENTGGRGPKIYKIRLTKVATINPEVLQRFIMGQQSHDNTVLTALTALNVVICMEPTMKYSFRVGSFFTDRETKDIGSGIVLWRGYFQSVQPAIGRLLVNVDISTGTIPKRGMPDRERTRLQRFIAGIRIITTYTGQRVRKTPRVVKKLSSAGTNNLSFTMRDGTTMTVAQYRPLTFPDNICIEGQIMRKQVPPEKMKDVLEFATKNPHDCLASITSGLAVLAYGQSQYMREFGMDVDDTVGPINLSARVLPPPRLRYGQGSPQPVVRFSRPATIDRWIVVVYECQQRFIQQSVQDMINGLVQCCCDIGEVNDTNPKVTWQNSQGRIADQLRQAGNKCFQKTQQRPTLIVVKLPDNANDIYTAAKHFGDVTCYRAKAQYYANVCLKINVKLGGINTIPDSQSVSILTDLQNPTIVMGMIHAPSFPRLSFTALVRNVDSNTAKYIATCRVQTSRKEIIEDLGEMAQKTSNIAPTRLIFFRDGVSEGQFQFQEVLDFGRLSINPKITMIVIAKRHHVRFFTTKLGDADRSGNCPAGTVIDQVVAHPVEFDWYLLSYGGLLGTSRPAHYTVLYDDNNFQSPYADIVCSRAKNHYDPRAGINLSDTATHTDTTGAESALEAYKRSFKPPHTNMTTLMYFS
ncbi:argonaute-like protein [Pisolithus marmoratus]|nr:argonaute-like protein [Pisolithus marmoratus]